jgi:hypothetical protein
MPMTTLERICRAIYKLGDNGPYELSEEDDQWHHHLDAARAILAELQNPSEAMAEAGATAAYDRVVDLDARDAGVIFSAMIDAALFGDA